GAFTASELLYLPQRPLSLHRGRSRRAPLGPKVTQPTQLQPACNLPAPTLKPPSCGAKELAMTIYAQPGAEGSKVTFKDRYETWDNGKPVRETLNADIPLAADHFRYFASAIRAQEGHLSQLDEDTTAYHFREPLGVVGQIIPWNFPILMAVWKLAPALAAGNA